MTAGPDQRLSRRRLLQISAAASVPALLAACGEGGDARTAATDDTAAAPEPSANRLEPTPACDDGDDPTPEQTEGPFFTPDSPRRASLLEAGVAGTVLILSGRVLDTACEPVPGALLDFWQANADGEYDNEGFALRGHQFADSRGRYRLETIVPARYTGRTRHIHVKAQPEGGATLTTQLYFPGEPGNAADALFDPRLVIDERAAGPRRRALFDFVLDT